MLMYRDGLIHLDEVYESCRIIEKENERLMEERDRYTVDIMHQYYSRLDEMEKNKLEPWYKKLFWFL